MLFRQKLLSSTKFVLLSAVLLLLCGCVPVIVAGAGVVAGYALSNDSAAGNIKEEYRVLWDLCVDKLESMDAEIHMSDESKGIIKALVSENSVAIKIAALNPKMQRLKVSARRCFLPKAQFAQKVFFKIIEDFQ